MTLSTACPKPRPRLLERHDARKQKDRAALTVRSLVRERDGFRCRCCGDRTVDVHHLTYRSRGGQNDATNLLCLCRLCHARAHAKELEIGGTDANKRLTFRRIR